MREPAEQRGDKEQGPCKDCGTPKVGMWVGGNTTPRRIEYFCPKCNDLLDRVGRLSK